MQSSVAHSTTENSRPLGRLKCESPPDVIRKIQDIEDRADKCYRKLELLQRDWNFAAWLGLCEAVRVVETSVPATLYPTRTQVSAVLNSSRAAAQLYQFACRYAVTRVLSPDRFAWTPRDAHNASEAFKIAFQYADLCSIFPAWHADRYAAQLLGDCAVRFSSNASPLGRRISAYQKGMRPQKLRDSIGNSTVQLNPDARRLLELSVRSAVQVSTHGVVYEN